MLNKTGAVELRIYLTESDHHAGQPRYEAIVRAAWEAGLAGATVIRGPLGFGRRHHVHRAKLLALAENLPLIVAIVDERARIEEFLGSHVPLLAGLLVTLTPIERVVLPPAADAEDRRS